MRRLKRALAGLSIAVLTLAALPALAQDTKSFLGKIGKGAGYAQNEDVSGGGLPQLIGNIVKVLLGILGIIFLVLMVYAGYLWMTARGDEKAVTKAKDIIKQAIIGVIITTLAYAITGFVVGSLIQASGSGGSGSGSQGVCNFGKACTGNAECGKDGFCSRDNECVCLE